MDGQISLFEYMDEIATEKPPIGTEIIFILNEKRYEAVVTKHMGFDYFYIKFKDRKPSDDNENLSDSDGWHVSLRGYKDCWLFK